MPSPSTACCCHANSRSDDAPVRERRGKMLPPRSAGYSIQNDLGCKCKRTVVHLELVSARGETVQINLNTLSTSDLTLQ